MEVENLGNMTFDEVSMERSKSFVKALQELKNLRPQLYSAAEYCEKSYLHSEQKQMVLDNLKDYSVRSLVNAVDHLGTVAYKLTDLLEQQAVDLLTMELKESCANQQLLTCRSYTDKEGLRQQQLLAFIPRHHKHYVLPNSVVKKVHFSPLVQSDARQTPLARSGIQPSGSPAAKTLSWHLSSDTKSTSNGSSNALTNYEGSQTLVAFQLLDKADKTPTRSFGAPTQLSSGNHPPGAVMQPSAALVREMTEGSKHLTAFRSFESPRRQVVHPPVRSRSMLSFLFAKQKAPKMKAGIVSQVLSQ